MGNPAVQEVDKTVYSPYGEQPALRLLRESGRPISFVARNADVSYHRAYRMLRGQSEVDLKLADFLIEMFQKPEEDLFTEIVRLRLYALREGGR